MQYTNIALFFLAASSSLVAATPAGRAGGVKRQANPAANDGAKVKNLSHVCTLSLVLMRIQKGILAAQNAELAKGLEDAGIGKCIQGRTACKIRIHIDRDPNKVGAITTGAQAQSILAELKASLGITATATAGAQATGAAGGQGKGQAQASGGAQAGASGASGEAKATGAAGNQGANNAQATGAAAAQQTGSAGAASGNGNGKGNGNGNGNGNGKGNGNGNAAANQAQQNADAVAKLSKANVAAQASQSAAIVAAQQGSPAGLR